VGCLQNHDQVGNRALGERTSRLLSPGLLKIGAALVMTSSFVPMLFQGEEWGASTPFLYFTDHREPELGEAVKRGRRKEFAAFGWESEEIPDPQDEETFAQSRLHWEELQEENSRHMLAWHQSLITLRRSLSSLNDGQIDRVSVFFNEAERWLTMARGPVLVACNFAETPRTIPCTDAKDKKMVLSSADDIVVEDTTLRIPAQGVAILLQ
jgi:maltooligosyltrehalose trehalohydrolase